MMKFCRGYSILILLSIFSYFAFAVICPKDKLYLKQSASFKECIGACVIFSCPGIANVAGCPEDFYDKCSEVSQSDIDFIRSKSPNNMVYQKSSVSYLSGCGNEKNGTQCMYELIPRMVKELPDNLKPGDLYWRDLSNDSNGDRLNPSGGVNSSSNGTSNKSSNSNGQNGAFKFIGIIVFGWILAAAWIS